MRTNIALALVRIYTGAALVAAGISKINGGWLKAPEGEGTKRKLEVILEGQLKSLADVSWLGWFHDLVQSTFLPNAAAFTYAVVFGEILIGAGFIVGFLTRTASIFALLMGGTFLLLGITNAAFLDQFGFRSGASTLILLTLVILLTDAGRRFGIDGKFRGES